MRMIGPKAVSLAGRRSCEKSFTAEAEITSHIVLLRQLLWYSNWLINELWKCRRHPLFSVPAKQCVRVCAFVCALIHTDWLEVSGAVWTADLFTRISGYLLRRAQAVNPTVAMKTSLREALENCIINFHVNTTGTASLMRWQNSSGEV